MVSRIPDLSLDVRMIQDMKGRGVYAVTVQNLTRSVSGDSVETRKCAHEDRGESHTNSVPRVELVRGPDRQPEENEVKALEGCERYAVGHIPE
jgi:hypothetical protein